MLPKQINELIEAYKLLPGIGQKNAERLAFYTIEMDKEQVEYLSSSIIKAKNNIKKCEKCNSYSEDNVCGICKDQGRKADLLCVVSEPRTVYLIEKSKIFPGKYFVLDDLISPIDGIDPEDIGIEQFLSYVKENDVKEIVVAFKQSIEGETTALYIKEILKEKEIKITRMASGIPIGADIEYIDDLTLERALEERKEI